MIIYYWLLLITYDTIYTRITVSRFKFTELVMSEIPTLRSQWRFFYKLAKAYHYTSPKSCKTWRWFRVGESKNVTPMSRATPISNALADSTCGGYRPWVSCRWYGVTIGTIIWAHMYPYVIHLIVLRYVYHPNGFTQLTPGTPVGEPLITLLFNPPLFARLSFPWTEISPKHNQGVIWAQNECHFWTQHPWKPLNRHFV